MTSSGAPLLLERDQLLDELAARLVAAREGTGTLALVAGEAGAGKTSLVSAFARRVGRDAEVLVGHCDPLTTPRPLSPLQDLAADSASGFGDLFDDEPEPIEVYRRVLAHLRGRLRPLLLIIEDVHWADDATLDLVRFVGRRVGDSHAVVTCTYRDDEVGADHPLRAVLGQLAPLESTRRLDVPPLSRRAVERLADGRSADIDRLHRITGGNAFYITEVLAAGETVPATVQDAVLARVGRLGPGARRVAEAVSIAPRALEIDLLETLVDATTADMDAAVGAGVLIGDGSSLRFRHELARAAVEEAVPPATRLGLHRAMIGLLTQRSERDVARLAHHAVRADAADLIVEHAPAAARQAAARGAHKQAIEFYEAALRFADHLETAEQARLHTELGGELGIADRSAEGLDHLDTASELFRQVGDPAGRAFVLTRAANLRWRVPDPETAYAMTEEALAIHDELGPSPEHAHVLYSAGYLNMLARRAGLAMDFCLRAMEMAEATGADSVKRYARMMWGTTHIVVGEPQRAIEILQEVKEEAERHGELNLVSACLGMLGSGGGEARLYDEAIAALEEAIDQGLATDHDYGVAYDRAWMARIAFEQGRWDDAVSWAELVDRTSGHRSGIAMVTALGALGRVRVRRGDPGGGTLLQEVLDMDGGHEMQHVWSPYCGMAEHAWLEGRGGEIPGILGDFYERALATDSLWARGEVGFWMWKAGAIDGPPDMAAEPFAAHMSGDWRRAAVLWREIGCPYEVALALADGDEHAVREAIEIFDRLGARPAGNWARARLREQGAGSVPRGPRATTLANPAGLTARQQEVLELVVKGLTNAEVAERLFLSKKTVEHHVSAIFAKLGVDTRAKAIAAALQAGAISK